MAGSFLPLAGGPQEPVDRIVQVLSDRLHLTAGLQVRRGKDTGQMFEGSTPGLGFIKDRLDNLHLLKRKACPGDARRTGLQTRVGRGSFHDVFLMKVMLISFAQGLRRNGGMLIYRALMVRLRS